MLRLKAAPMTTRSRSDIPRSRLIATEFLDLFGQPAEETVLGWLCGVMREDLSHHFLMSLITKRPFDCDGMIIPIILRPPRSWNRVGVGVLAALVWVCGSSPKNRLSARA